MASYHQIDSVEEKEIVGLLHFFLELNVVIWFHFYRSIISAKTTMCIDTGRKILINTTLCVEEWVPGRSSWGAPTLRIIRTDRLIWTHCRRNLESSDRLTRDLL
jgi:hypothetical protein